MTPPALSPPLRIDRTLPWALAGLALALALFELTDIDLRVQDTLFDAARGAWRVDEDDRLGRTLFYSGPKILLIGFGLAVIAMACVSERRRDELGFGQVHRRDFWVLALTLATTPALVGGLKDATNVFCPRDLQRYGGAVPYMKLFPLFPASDRPARRGYCFPAGHASGAAWRWRWPPAA